MEIPFNLVYHVEDEKLAVQRGIWLSTFVAETHVC